MLYLHLSILILIFLIALMIGVFLLMVNSVDLVLLLLGGFGLEEGVLGLLAMVGRLVGSICGKGLGF